MIRSLITGMLLWSAQAVIPRDLNARAVATCNRDNCYRDVFGTNVAGRSASGAAACTAYLQKTVSPCPLTSTSTATVTSTVATTTSTSTASVTTTTTSTSTSTITTTSTTTVTVTAAPNKKRALEVRAVVTPTPVCSAVTTSAASTSIPKYASDCTGTRFSSVCSCNGNVPTATTLPASTQMIITTSISSVTASTAVVTTFTDTSTVTVVTSTTTTATATVTTTTTAQAAVPTCNAAQNAACGNDYVCEIDVTTGAPFCFDQYNCPTNGCSSDSQCSSEYPNSNTPFCLYDSYLSSYFCYGTTLCAGVS